MCKIYLSFLKISSVLRSMLYFSFCVLITLGDNIELQTFKIKLLRVLSIDK